MNPISYNDIIDVLNGIKEHALSVPSKASLLLLLDKELEKFRNMQLKDFNG